MAHTTVFDFRGKKYAAYSEMVDTDYGPENKVTFWSEGKKVATWSECARTETIVAWFKESLADFPE